MKTGKRKYQKVGNKKFSKLLDVAKKMPPLYHTLPGEEFDIEKSEIAKWLIQQPEILQYIFNRINGSAYIRYNSETGKWEGVDYYDK